MRLSSLNLLTDMKSAKVSLVVWKIRLPLKSKYSNMNACFFWEEHVISPEQNINSMTL